MCILLYLYSYTLEIIKFKLFANKSKSQREEKLKSFKDTNFIHLTSQETPGHLHVRDATAALGVPGHSKRQASSASLGTVHCS